MVALIGLILMSIWVWHETLLLVEISVHLGNVRRLIVSEKLAVATPVDVAPSVVQFSILRGQISNQIWNRLHRLIEAIVAVAHGQIFCTLEG